MFHRANLLSKTLSLLLNLGGNYPTLVLPDGHPDSFPSTRPLGFAAAIYCISLFNGLGSGLVSIFAGALSDKFGRKPILLANLLGGTAATIAKYLARRNYWAFCAMVFVNGLFQSTPAISMVYVSDLFKDDRKRTDGAMGAIVALVVLGRSAGLILGLTMPNHLFGPLLPAAGITFFLAVYAYYNLPESSSVEMDKIEEEQEKLLRPSMEGGKLDPRKTTEEANEPEKNVGPDELHNATLFNIIAGAFADNFGSTALVRKYGVLRGHSKRVLDSSL